MFIRFLNFLEARMTNSHNENDPRLKQDRIERKDQQNASSGMIAGVIIVIIAILGLFLYYNYEVAPVTASTEPTVAPPTPQTTPTPAERDLQTTPNNPTSENNTNTATDTTVPAGNTAPANTTTAPATNP
jgi:cytoskeletal protein RodZ